MPQYPSQDFPPPHAVRARCIFVTGPRNSGKTLHILQSLRRIAATAHTPEGTVAVLLAEDGRTRSENLSAAFRGLILRKLFLPCQCCPELARLPANLRAIADANPRLEQVFIEVPDVPALRFIQEFDETLGWPRSVALCISPAWAKARRIGLLSPFQNLLFDTADEIVESQPSASQDPADAHRRADPSPTTAPFHMTL